MPSLLLRAALLLGLLQFYYHVGAQYYAESSGSFPSEDFEDDPPQSQSPKDLQELLHQKDLALLQLKTELAESEVKQAGLQHQLDKVHQNLTAAVGDGEHQISGKRRLRNREQGVGKGGSDGEARSLRSDRRLEQMEQRWQGRPRSRQRLNKIDATQPKPFGDSTALASPPAIINTHSHQPPSVYNLQERYENILFHHFPKTGGTTLAGILEQHAHLTNQSISACYQFNVESGQCVGSSRFPSFQDDNPTKFVVGHTISYEFGDQHGLLNATYMMMLREPLSWMISRYFVDIYKDPHHEKDLSFTQLDTWAEDTWADHMLNYWEALAPRSAKQGADTHEQWLENRGPTWEEIEEIKTLLQDNLLVLLTDEFEDSMDLLEYALGSPHSLAFKNYQEKNTLAKKDIDYDDDRTHFNVKDLKEVAHMLPKMDYIYSFAEYWFHLEVEQMRAAKEAR